MKFSRVALPFLLCAVAMFVRSANGALLAYEPFTNSPGTPIIGSSDGFGFSGSWQENGSTGVATNLSSGLTYTDSAAHALVTSGGAGFFQGSTSASAAMQPIRLFDFSRGTNGADGGTTWISFLVVRRGPTGTLAGNPYGRGANVCHDINAGAVQKLAVGNSSGVATNTVGLIPEGKSANLKSSAYTFGSVTNFVVVRIDHVMGANDRTWLFVNPGLAAEPSTNAASASSLDGFDFSFDRLRIFVGGQSSSSQPYAEMIVDEYRVGETYSDVAPFTMIPPPEPLAITNTAFNSGSLVCSGAGGKPNENFYVLTATNLSLPATNWAIAATNQFDSAGRFVFSTPFSQTDAARFFRLYSGPLTGNEAVDTNGAYFVSPTGNDSYPGTIDHPFLTIDKGVTAVGGGGQLYIRGGTYAMSGKLRLSQTGSPTNRIRVWAYPGETVVINSAGNSSDGISINGNWYHLKGFTVMNAGHNGINISGNSNIVEFCAVHDNGNTGLHITGGSSGSTFPAYNLILNCDSYLNYDPPIGGNADGFSAKWNLGPGNVFSGCRAWWNSDDGWDLWMGTSAVTISNCWAFWSGTNYWNSPDFNGNGNGFKLGGNYVGAPHRLVRSVAFVNEVNGVDQNNNISGQTLDNNTSWGNRARNFSMNHGTNTTPHVVRNNLSFGGGTSDAFTAGTLATNNSWQILSPAANSGDVLSTDTSGAAGPRKPDGSLPDLPFLRPAPGGRLVDQGVDLGEPFGGAAPDLGAFETP